MDRSPGISIPADGATLQGDLEGPLDPRGLVIFVHGSGSSRFSARNRAVARVVREAGFATLLADLLSPSEEALDRMTSALRFDIPLLAERTRTMIGWCASRPPFAAVPIGLFGASTGAAAAIVAASTQPERVRAVVSRGGRIDLAGDHLAALDAPLLMLVGENDEPLVELHERNIPRLRCAHRYVVIPGASHLFEETGALERVASLAAGWFDEHLARKRIGST